jgi:Papain family cysteine protease
MAAAIAAFALLALPSAASAHGMGLLVRPEARPSRTAIAKVRAAAVGVPASVDLRTDTVPPGDQGQVNSCAAWATAYTALGYWENRLGIQGGALAPMYTYSQVDGGSDNGSYITDNLDVATSQGVDNQADYSQGNYDWWDLPTASEQLNAQRWQLTGYQQLTIQESSSSTVTEESIEAALANGTPVVIGLPVYRNFQQLSSANGGYYAGISGPFEGLHAVTAVGYDGSGLLIENSWSTGWGDGGYATLSWAFVNTYVNEADAVGPLVYSGLLNTTRPSVSGSAYVGETLSAGTGSWNPAATSYGYQWERSTDGGTSWSSITGATSASYELTSADVGSKVRVSVLADDGSTQGTAHSPAVGPVLSGVPSNVVRPVISGAARVGQTLSATAGVWVPAGASLAYQWQRSTDGGDTWSPIAGATTSAYTLGRADVGNEVLVTVAASNTHGQSTAHSDLTETVLSAAPRNTGLPLVHGRARLGSVLSASTGVWDAPVSSYAYRWQRSPDGGFTWRYIAGATGSTYRLSAPDVGNVIRAEVTAANDSGSARAPSFMTGAILAGAGSPRATLAIGRPALAGGALRFAVTVVRGSGQVKAVATRGRVSVTLHRGGSGRRFVLSGRLGRGRWTISVRILAARGWSSSSYRFAVTVR